MRAFMKSDLFRNWLGGFVLGVVGIMTLSPAAQTAELKTRIADAYQSIV